MKTIEDYKAIKKKALESDKEIQHLLEFFERLPLGELRTSHLYVAKWAMRYGFQVELVSTVGASEWRIEFVSTVGASEWRIKIPD